MLFHKKHYVDSAQFFTSLFGSRPPSAFELSEGVRRKAAFAAAMAAAGMGKGADRLSQEQKVTLRNQAYKWLRTDLAVWKKDLKRKPGLLGALFGSSKPSFADVRAVLLKLRYSPHLASVREPSELAKLPEEERKAWQKLWADVDTLMVETHSDPPPAKGEPSR